MTIAREWYWADLIQRREYAEIKRDLGRARCWDDRVSVDARERMAERYMRDLKAGNLAEPAGRDKPFRFEPVPPPEWGNDEATGVWWRMRARLYPARHPRLEMGEEEFRSTLWIFTEADHQAFERWLVE